MFVNWSAVAIPAGSVIEIGLIAVVVEAPKVVVGVLAETLYHKTLASVGTANVVAATPEEE